MSLGYVVIKWASGQPDLLSLGELHSSENDARIIAAEERRSAHERGRRERYTVAEVVEIEADS